MDQMTDFKAFKEKSGIDLEYYKDTLDKTLKSIQYQFDISEKNIKEYSSKTLRQMELVYQDDIKDFLQRIDDVRLENGKYYLEAKKSSAELKEKIEECGKIKEELKQMWEVELQKVLNYHGYQYTGVIDDMKKIQEEIAEIKETLKVLSISLFFRSIKRV